jgi:putative exosortase-associated protein (TIGR04073 family)
VTTRTLALALLILVTAVPVGAQTAGRKFGRALAAMTTSFLEIPGNMVAESRARGNAEGLPLGFARGCGMIVPRVLVGVFEFVTAPFAAPAGYRPILEPEFPWSYFDEGGAAPRRAH